MSAKHTPGPWKAQRDLRHPCYGGVLHDACPKAWGVYGQSYRVCEITTRSVISGGTTGRTVAVEWNQDTESEANARLVAAAPDLLAALKRVMACPAMNENMASPETIKAYDDAIDAIAKATCAP